MMSATMTPKRKRVATLVPQINTLFTERGREPDPESPRSRVADNLLNLVIQDQPASSPSVRTQASKKRHLQDGGAADIHIIPEDAGGNAGAGRTRTWVTTPKDPSPPSTMDGITEIGETPGAYTSYTQRFPSSPPMSPTPSPRDLVEEGIADSEDEEEEIASASRGRFQPRRNSAYRSLSHTSAGRRASCDDIGGAEAVTGVEALRQEQVQVPPISGDQKVQSRRKSKCAIVPITVPPPPTPVTSPGEETTQPILATAAARVLSVSTLLIPSHDESDTAPSPQKKRRKSPPPPAPTSAPRSPISMHASTDNAAKGPADASMTWHDSEITGHLWNPGTDMDDDGEGINGIGFRPTAAI